MKKEYIYIICNFERGKLMYIDEMDKKKLDSVNIVPFNSDQEYQKECGYYYVSPETCKDIIIKAGACGFHTHKAIQILWLYISHMNVMEKVIPAFRFLKQDIIACYMGELAESLECAARNGKGIEIAIGYPKMLVIYVS